MVVVVNVDVNTLAGSEFSELADSAFLPGVHKDQPFDPIKVHVLEFGEVEQVGRGMEKEIPQVFFLGPRKDERGAGVKFLGCNHGGQSIEVRIQMRGDDLFMRLFSRRRLQISIRSRAFHIRIIAQSIGRT